MAYEAPTLRARKLSVPHTRRRSLRSRTVEKPGLQPIKNEFPKPQVHCPQRRRRNSNISTASVADVDENPQSPSNSSVTSVNNEAGSSRVRLHRQGHDWNVEEVPSEDSGELERWRRWLDCCGGSLQASGFGLRATVLSYQSRSPGRPSTSAPSSPPSPTMRDVRFRLDIPNVAASSPAFTRAPAHPRQVMRFAGLCLVLNWNHEAVEDASCCTRVVVVVLSWQLRCFCLSMTGRVHRSLLAESKALSNSNICWLKGHVKPTANASARESFSLLHDLDLVSSRLNDCVSIEVERGKRFALPCLSLSHRTSAEVLGPQCALSKMFCKFLHSEAVRLYTRDRRPVSKIFGSTRFFKDPRPRPRRTRRRLRSNAVPDGRANAQIDIPSVQLLEKRSRMRAVENDDDDSEEDTTVAAYKRRHYFLEQAEKEARLSVSNVPEMWAVCENPACRKWRILLPGAVFNESDQFFCGGGVGIDRDKCAELDDWIVQCVGAEGARVCASHGVSTVENLPDNEDLLAELCGLGFYYERQSQAILAYS